MGDSCITLMGTKGGAPCRGVKRHLWPETQFIADYLREPLSVTELCDLYGISRKTAYKWIERYMPHGPAGLRSTHAGHMIYQIANRSRYCRGLRSGPLRHILHGARKLLPLVQKRHS